MTIRMTKKMTAVLCAAFLLCGGLSGCRLAVPDKEGSATGDRLIGAYITYDGLDMPDLDSISVNSTGTLTAGDLNQRIYAKKKSVVLYGHRTTEYEFPGVDGIAMFDTGAAGQGETVHSCPQSGGEMMDLNVAVTNSDSEKLSGTLYIASSTKDLILCLNPVHMTEDGRVYVTPGTGCSASGEGIALGQTMSQTITETAAATDNNKKTSFTMTVELNEKFVNAPKEIVFKQMNGQDKIIAVTKVTAETIPAAITKKPDTAYIIVENHGISSKNISITTREILNNDTDYYISKFCNSHGVSVGKSIAIK